jgi:hypothetical protein
LISLLALTEQHDREASYSALLLATGLPFE